MRNAIAELTARDESYDDEVAAMFKGMDTMSYHQLGEEVGKHSKYGEPAYIAGHQVLNEGVENEGRATRELIKSANISR